MYSKEDILAAIWQNPDSATGLHFERKGNKWQSRQRSNGEATNRTDRIVLEQRGSDGQIFYYEHGESATKQNGDIWELLKYIYATNDFSEILERAAQAYGIQPTFSSPEQQQRATIAAIAAEAAGILKTALHQEAGSAAREYLQGRGLQATTHFAAFSAALRQELTDKLQKKYNGEDVRNAINSLFPVMRKDFSTDKAGKWQDFADAYGLLIPYYSGTRLYGFCMRLTAKETPTYTDENGVQQEMPKYIYSRGKDKGGIMEKGGYCPEGLNPSEPAYLVEGLLDAEAMLQAGFSSVLALGGMTPTDKDEAPNSSQIKTLQRYGVRNVVYMPDNETDAAGHQKTKATENTIKALLPYMTGGIDGAGIVSLCIVWGGTPEGAKDAADILKDYGAEGLQKCVGFIMPWYEWQTQQILLQHEGNTADIAAAFVEMYNSIQSPIERQLIRNDLTLKAGSEAMKTLKAAGITAAALQGIDRTGRATTYRSKMTEAIENLKAAADRHADAETIGGLLTKAEKVQHYDAGRTFAAQVNATADIIGAQIAQETDYIQTCWDMYKDGRAVRKISFAPASVSVFAAPTSHGKTLVMLQAALYLAQTHQEHVLYIGLENDAKQLFVRALAAYIGDEWKGKRIENPRKAVRQYFKQQAFGGDIFQDKDTEEMIQRKAADFSREIMPFLHLVRVGSDCDSLCSNIRAQVDEWRSKGAQVAAVFIDYIQLLHLAGRNYSRTDEMKVICDNINELAKATGLPIIVGSQMNRTATKGEGNTPAIDSIDLYNLGESSGIENIAEDCFLIWNTNRTNTNQYTDKDGILKPYSKLLQRSKHIFAEDSNGNAVTRKGYVYIESLKSREYDTNCYCLIPANFGAGTLNTSETTKQ